MTPTGPTKQDFEPDEEECISDELRYWGIFIIFAAIYIIYYAFVRK
jgi:hypothetical protein